MSKQTKGKDKNGVFHPGKGKPSGINKQEGLGVQNTDPDKMDQYIEMTEKYTLDADTLDPSVPVRHPNRNTSKGKDTYKAKENKQETDKSSNEYFSENRSTVTIEELPGVFTKESFKDLASYQAPCCISIFLQSHPSGVEINEQYDPLKFKTQLQEIYQRLLDKGHDEGFARSLLAPGFELVRDDKFWKDLTPGLAIFMAPGYFKFSKMPVPPPEPITVIEPSFYVTPLIPLVDGGSYFYILVISKRSAKLFKADAWSIQPVPLEFPQGVEAVKRLSGLDATTFRPGSSGARAPVASQEGAYHGIGGGNPDGKDNLLVYFEAVDDVLWEKVLNKENAPLLLAGVEYEIPIYRSACDYHNIWPEALTGNRERQETNSLYADAKKIMQPYFDQQVTRALDLYLNNSGNGKTSSIAADIIPAAHYAQVSHLFVAKGEHIWGHFHDMDNKLVIHDTPDEGGEDLVDVAVQKTLANGGEVFLLDQEKMPGDTQLAALLRY